MVFRVFKLILWLKIYYFLHFPSKPKLSCCLCLPQYEIVETFYDFATARTFKMTLSFLVKKCDIYDDYF